MKKKIKRIFDVAWTNFRRNTYTSIGTTGIMVLVLILFSGLMTVNFLSDEIVSSLQDKVDVSAYFKQDANENEILEVKKDVEAMPNVKSVTYISREQALADFKARHAGDALIQDSLAELAENPLQASLNIKAKDTSKYAEIANALEGNKYRTLIDKINYYENEAVIQRVEGIAGGLKNWGLLATLVLAVIAVLVTFNTIRLTIYNQKQEIEIMRLVGGSNWQIKAPYLVEGAVYGVIAAGVTAVLFYPMAYIISPRIASLMPEVSVISYFISNFFQYIFLILLAGVLLGTASSLIAIRKFLKI
ncbi:MAG: hypothetical protein UW43_C0001G0041 [Candidatus Yanofskybacteria bacterium GW2011_GWA1_44_21]|uniref:Cell division protein FtsX n=2 Tax=Candidatus Yanofskyibacteriota TaxID=1752733 RepID=A0A1F8H0B7_9BACT|nr:MAG: hypothetical protein UW14_C0006G0033 [Candidatus Yanofskybacteria bacterium GW2011_GWA2_44_10]KKT50876.1 MAG: hypothetical protein UW43_C0001G0041 [Candidatus Yanofskybacteria bacterium GW2011_GWA1_44_21]KKT90448.1 MAG: hypothetical protein UW90_C0001G0036 [Candidatus Yanofskybacteria bacterium GW2011_GWB1_45_11]OGN02298.1 MAG: hypothetical protein A2657_00935 [Candidatus Yanofskybacteria bacterium RIFCSPHIGHO2_01_FULL_44_110b]OGN14256.1 MAG: hypothetical protein A3C01_01525 [Candidatus